jgi:hypothetical protein
MGTDNGMVILHNTRIASHSKHSCGMNKTAEGGSHFARKGFGLSRQKIAHNSTGDSETRNDRWILIGAEDCGLTKHHTISHLNHGGNQNE